MNFKKYYEIRTQYVKNHQTLFTLQQISHLFKNRGLKQFDQEIATIIGPTNGN